MGQIPICILMLTGCMNFIRIWMIITTNLKLAELKNPPDLAHARIYDRILERCAPILFAGKNFREENAGATRQTAKDLVNRKHE